MARTYGRARSGSDGRRWSRLTVEDHDLPIEDQRRSTTPFLIGHTRTPLRQATPLPYEREPAGLRLSLHVTHAPFTQPAHSESEIEQSSAPPDPFQGDPGGARGGGKHEARHIDAPRIRPSARRRRRRLRVRMRVHPVPRRRGWAPSPRSILTRRAVAGRTSLAKLSPGGRRGNSSAPAQRSNPVGGGRYSPAPTCSTSNANAAGAWELILFPRPCT